MKPSETLATGREALLEHGWVRFSLGGPTVGYCAVGALFQLSGSAKERVATPYLFRALDLPLGDTSNPAWRGPLVDWNNAPERTLTDVLDAFDHAIKLAREDEALEEEAKENAS